MKPPYNALANHAVYMPDLYRRLIPNAVSFATLRNPIEQFISSWGMFPVTHKQHFGGELGEAMDSLNVTKVRSPYELTTTSNLLKFHLYHYSTGDLVDEQVERPIGLVRSEIAGDDSGVNTGHRAKLDLWLHYGEV